MRTHRLPLVALVALLVVALAAPVGAESTTNARRRREATRSKRAQAAAKLNALKATDAQLEAAVRTLDRQAKAQAAQAVAARRSLDAALMSVQRAEAKLAATSKQMADLKGAVVNRAVAAFVRPKDDMFTELVASKDLNEASRRTALLSQVANRDHDVIDQLRATKQDYEEEQAKAAKARELAAARRKNEEAKLASVVRARNEKARLAKALDVRIREYQQEVDALLRDESNLSNLIRSKDTFVPGSVSATGLIWPTRGRLTSGFGRRWGRLHAGIDLASPTGTPIHAAKDGVVIYSGRMSGYGNVIVISHGGGLTTLYGHQSRLAAGDGARVSRGQTIGYVGSTGRSTGPHLHFETRINGSPQNPRRFLS
ncbi:MAG TPA: peptidoglycan DD-metalloendopeptidase family protein [Acidimicrobiales bacterium]|nr:peptidoglycan DD-metalloendopeptidase family protein [Acidimicrobiales bacterium]